MDRPGRWDLDVLYSAFDCSEFRSDWERLTALVEGQATLADEAFTSHDDVGGTVERWLRRQIEVYELAGRLGSFGQLTMAVDAGNEEAPRHASRLGMLLTKLTRPGVRFMRWLSAAPDLDAAIAGSPFLREHAFVISSTLEHCRYLLDEDVEELTGKLNQTGASAWTTLYEAMVALHQVPVPAGDGTTESLPLSVVKNSYATADTARREVLHAAEVASYRGGLARVAAASMNAIKGQVITMTERRGYESPLHKTLVSQHMDRATLTALHAAVAESFPAYRRYFRRKGEVLGLEGPPAQWDLPARVGSLRRVFTWDEARRFVVRAFRTFDDELADMADRAFAERWVDGEPRPGKQGGAFCSPLKTLEQSRILCTFTGSYADIITLAHELGHAYHNHCQRGQTILNSGAPMPLAETASVFCETVVGESARAEATGDELLALLDSSLYEQCRVTLDVHARFLFEDAVFDRRRSGALSVTDLTRLMGEAQAACYGDGLRPGGLDDTAWIEKSHYYVAGMSYYNFPYAFGLLFARGLYARFRAEGASFVPEYRRLLASTATAPVAEVAASVGVDVRDPAFWRSSLALVEADIDRFLALGGRAS